MYDPDEIAELVKRYEELLPKLKRPEVRARLIADGRDPDAVLRDLTAKMDQLLAADKVCEEKLEAYLQATANMTDESNKLFKMLRQVVQQYKQANPLDPRVEEWEELLEIWARQVPKEPDE